MTILAEATAVSDRAVLAIRRRNDYFELFRSQWADTEGLLWAVANGTDVTTACRGDSTWSECGRKRWQDLVDALSYLEMDLCLRCIDTTSTAYLPVWAGIPARGTERTPTNCGALVRVNDMLEDDQLRRQFRQYKECLGVAIERGELDTGAALRQLLSACEPRERHVTASARQILTESDR